MILGQFIIYEHSFYELYAFLAHQSRRLQVRLQGSLLNRQLSVVIYLYQHFQMTSCLKLLGRAQIVSGTSLGWGIESLGGGVGS